MTTSSASFTRAYSSLNPEQKLAVDTLDGPLLVLAGPGTGKTQLLSARVANILRETDASPSNILCLTFTESGALNMRSRLREFIGDSAYDVTISTYHSFGSDLIKRYPEYFQEISLDRTADVRLEHPLDEIAQIQIIESLLTRLPYDNSLLSARYYLKDVVKTISDLKQHLYTPAQLKALGHANLQEIDSVQGILDEVVNNPGGISRKKGEWQRQYTTLLSSLTTVPGDLIQSATADLSSALAESETENSSRPLTAWKNKWLHKDEHDRATLTNRAHSEKMLELADLYSAYEQALQAEGLYDYDDMILRSIAGITQSDELRYNLQERYQYLLLDEFQDTNPSQFKLVKLLADHPVHEGRPNLMAVGDDDQAIYAFQGASVGNIQNFLDSFRDVKVINLVANYRSHQDVLHFAQNISGQITSRLHHNLPGISKDLFARSPTLPASSILLRSEHASASAEYAWVTAEITKLIKAGTAPSQIAVLSPKHAWLENLVPFLKSASLPVSYEKRENILDTPLIRSLALSAELLTALSTHHQARINESFPKVLSLPYWEHSALDIWNINWQLSKRDEKRSWDQLALENPNLAPAVTFYLSLAELAPTAPLEHVLDQLLGTKEVEINHTSYFSPLKQYYFSKERREQGALEYYESISHLSLIRQHLRNYQRSRHHFLTLADFLNFIAMYDSAGEGLVNTHGITSQADSIQLLTAYKAKGLEFDHVFILHALDDVWGSTSRGSGSKLSLPPNLSHIRYTRSSDDERLRLFFVAITRARYGLYLSSHTHREDGKPTLPMKYLSELGGISPHLPSASQQILAPAVTPFELAEHEATLWSAGRLTLPVDFRALLRPQLDSYLMSPTHLNTFMDLEHAGPEAFLTKTLLRFPSAPTVESEYGVAIHNTLEWYQNQCRSTHPPTLSTLLAEYSSELSNRYLTPAEQDAMDQKGRQVLTEYLKARADMLVKPAQAEVNFYHEGVVVDGARLTGKIDRLELDSVNKTLRIVDFKTGRPLTKWDSSVKAYKYRHQLYFYKLLIEHSATFRGYTVQDARLEFVEPTNLKTGHLTPPLVVQFDPLEEQAFRKLLRVVWGLIQSLDFPDTHKYSPDLRGTRAFERDLLST